MVSLKYTFTAVNRESIKPEYYEDLSRLFYSNSLRSGLPCPTIKHFFNELIKPVDTDIGELYILAIKEKENKVIGYLKLEYRVNEINDMTYSTLEMFVDPKERRKKVGTNLFNQIITKKPEILKTIRIEVEKGNFISQLINTKVGLFPSYSVIQSISRISSLEKEFYIEDLKKKEESLLHDNIRLLYRNNENYRDIEMEYSELMKRTWNTPPDVDVTEIKNEDFPVERVRGMMEYIKNIGGSYHAFLAQNEISNEILGVCHIMILEENPKRAYQSFTAVLPSYRGRGIGYALKLKVLNYLFETEVEFWTTENAEINRSMLKINKKLGFREFNKIEVFELQEKDWKKMIEMFVKS